MSIGTHHGFGEGIQHWSIRGGRTECMWEHQDAIARIHTYTRQRREKAGIFLSIGSKMLYIGTNVYE